VVVHDGGTVPIGQLEEDRGLLTSRVCEEAENKLYSKDGYWSL
jgi:hypothetical protein